VSGVPVQAALAGGFLLSTVRRQQVVARTECFACLRWLRIPVLGYGGHHLPGHAHSAAAMVSGDVVDDDIKERCQRSGPTTRAESEAVSNRLDLAA
jgi:hypothetical protein